MKNLIISVIEWEWEDELPEMSDEEFNKIFRASELHDGVRMYPFVSDGNGGRVWLSGIEPGILLARKMRIQK